MYKIKISLKGKKTGMILRPGEALGISELPDILIENDEDIKDGKDIYVEIEAIPRYRLRETEMR